MAIQRLTLSAIETTILNALGYSASTVSPWKTSANLYLVVNSYMQRLPQKVSVTANNLRAQGVSLPYSGIPRFDMWLSTGTLTATSGSSSIYMPIDYDHWISFYDSTNGATVFPVENTSRYHLDLLKKRSAGPPEAIEIQGFVTYLATWVRKGVLYPPTASGVTPSISATYWRIPASMPGVAPAAEYPDIDPKYEAIAIYGPLVDLSRTTGKEHERFQAIEKEMLNEMAMTARGA